MSDLTAKAGLSLEVDPSLRIRLAQKKDLPALEWEGEFIHFRQLFALAYYRAEKGRALLWLLEENEKRLVGQVFVLLKSSGDPSVADGRRRAFIHSFRVRPTMRNRGLGKALMEHAENDLISRGFRWATLNVALDNPDALRFYERMQYQRVGQEEGLWSYMDHMGRLREVHEPSWSMRKKLGNS
jgi:ribosomal protein S18 acetylase RimI-like enzyme